MLQLLIPKQINTMTKCKKIYIYISGTKTKKFTSSKTKDLYYTVKPKILKKSSKSRQKKLLY